MKTKTYFFSGITSREDNREELSKFNGTCELFSNFDFAIAITQLERHVKADYEAKHGSEVPVKAIILSFNQV